jgi:RNA polymerase sigma-70 factor (ECF subfamily)
MALPAADDTPPPSLADLRDRLAAGDEAAAREVHRLYTPRLMALARQRFGPAVRGKVDPESVVQSVFGSFFRRYEAGQFRVGQWDDLWGLLAVLTVRKCANRRRFHRRECRDVLREVPLAGTGGPDGGGRPPAARDPGPHEAVALAEAVELAVAGLDDRERQVIELLLAGHTVEAVRAEVGCGERTVRRIRDRVRQRLRRLGLGPDG